MKKAMIISAVLALMAVPMLAEAGPSAGISYTDVGISGHAGRPGGSLNLGNVYRGGVVVDGSVTAARGFDQFDVSVGKLIPADGLEFDPYASANFMNVNYSNPAANSVQDFYGLAGVNVSLPLSREVALGVGGGYGHTMGVYGDASGGSVYTGDAIASFKIAQHVTTDLQVAYQHVPGASMTDYSAGINYHF
ncbi:hypothetical protein [Acidithiobacillus ferriphilus]|uniref:hypothetical protein n=1 Tax=Acidithiobacillus ferriphilus TaxID=1689834 RepID=UPI001C07512F|nr:hypothetical protein [Acidithiobacillus ferriphilus]MBU2833024.1 hypothetical protein [Acidithiobacillus ferriphilus]